MKSFSAFVFLMMAMPFLVRGQAFTVSAVSDLTRVFEDGYRLPPLSDTIKLFGIRGEVISGQCVIAAKRDLANVTASPGELTQTSTRHTLSPDFIELNFVGSILLKENAPNQPADVVVRRAPARFPDYLMTEKQVTVRAGYQSIWLTISIPESMEAGVFAGTITVRSDKDQQALPLSLTVYPLSLPPARHLKVTEWYSTGNFERFHGIGRKYSEPWFRMLAAYAENMAAHRQNVFQVPMNSIEIQRSKDGALDFDFTYFDRIARVFWDTKKMDYLETGELTKFKEDWFSTEILLKDFIVKNSTTGATLTVAGKDVAPALLPALENHLRQQGWLDKTLFHVKDEPSLHNAAAWREMSSYIHRYAPSLKRIDAIETTDVLNDIEIAVPKLDAFGSWLDTYQQARGKGTELWFYTVGIYQGSLYPNKTIDMPLMDNRILHWLNYKFDATGFLHWGWNQWTNDPYNEVGQHIGDGWHVYPVKDGVVNSLRWEEMRNGIQDYECFRMLEDKIRALRDSLGSRFGWIDPKQRGKEIAGKVVVSLAKYTNDPRVLYDAKRKIISELLDFDKGAAAYVQTNPPEYSTLTDGSSVEVFGWTAPNSKISVNEKEIPVDKYGFFGDKFSVSKVDSHIRIKVRNARGSREIIRDFTML